MVTLYIHIPFCRRKCSYCDFYSISYNENLASSYIDVICQQVSALRDDFSSIYIGGGTPTVIGNQALKKLLKSLKKVAAGAEEFTIEANPESIDDEKLHIFRDQGINRLSMRLQSLRDYKLKELGRIHGAAEAVQKLILAQASGFKNISVDLIFGVWNQSEKDWHRELNEVVKLPITHLSCYALTIEKTTPFYRAIQRGTLPALSEERAAAMYRYAMEYLPQQGFSHYEVSNFAQPQAACLHNLNYWDNGEYVGLGPSAVSCKAGIRSRNTRRLKDYMKRLERGESPVVFSERLKPLARAKETASLKIRTREGIVFSDFKKRTGFDFFELERENLKSLIKKRLVTYKGHNQKPSGLCLTERGFLFADTVCAALL